MTSGRPIDAEAIRVGRILRQIREQQDRTQSQVAGAIGKGEGAYAAYEAGRSRFTLPELPLIAQGLGVPLPYLSRRLGLCGDDTALSELLVEYAGPEVGEVVAMALTRYPALDPDRRTFFVELLRRV